MGTEKKFKFNWRNTVDGEPDAQTRMDWVEQMGTPYPREHVMKLFREARERHEKRKVEGKGDEPKRTKKKKKSKAPEVRVIQDLVLDLSDDEESMQRRKKEAADGASSSSSAEDTEATGTFPEQPPKSLVQTRIDHMFQTPVCVSEHSTLLDD